MANLASASAGGAASHLRRRAAYRAGQFLRSLRPRLTPGDAAEVRRLLSPSQLRLFLQMEPHDRRQAVDVMLWLQHHVDPAPASDLLVAGLLHDAGKGSLRRGDRVRFVLLHALSPRLVKRLASERGPRWRRALWSLWHHARLGAELLAAAGTRPAVVDIVARHTLPLATVAADERELRWLIMADNAS
ncbi:MAG: hypothetical protein EXR65_02955 [Dehalococcoidia bacterium]|nr:hypothetical protein [Dehalococcoidia bacterium]